MKKKKLNGIKADVKRRGILAHFSSMEFDAEKKQRFLDSGHDWKTDEDGVIDIFGNESGDHNGPLCKKCGYDKCWHCNSNPTKCPCV